MRTRRPRSGRWGMSAGFNLMELLVVVMIMAILAVMAIPGYFKTIETSKASDAQAMVNMIGHAHRVYALDNNDTYLTTTATIDAAHTLVQKKYVGASDWAKSAYDFYSCPPTGAAASCCSGGTCPSGSVTRPVACGRRKSGSSSPYSSWGYVVTEAGMLCWQGTNVPQP